MKHSDSLESSLLDKRDQLYDVLLDGGCDEEFNENEVIIFSIYEQLKSGSSEFYLEWKHIERIQKHLSDKRLGEDFASKLKGYLDFDEFYNLMTEKIILFEGQTQAEAYFVIYDELLEGDIDKTECCKIKCCCCWNYVLKALAFQKSLCKFTWICCNMSTIRQNNMKERLNKLRHLYPSKQELNGTQKDLIKQCPSKYSLLKDAFRGSLPAKDFISDVFFVVMIYYTNLKERDKAITSGSNDDDYEVYKKSYFIALLVSLVSTSTPIMFMLSCIFVVKFSQGDFETNWKEYKPCKKFIHYILLTVYGYLVMILVFSVQVIMKIILLLSAFLGNEKYKITEQFFEKALYLSGLTLIQITQLEKSTKVSQALFEDFPQGMLMILMYCGYLRCDLLTNSSENKEQDSRDGEEEDSDNQGGEFNLGPLGKIDKFTIVIITFSLSCLNIFNIFFTIITESYSLKEHGLIYLQTRMTANNKWFPLDSYFLTKELKDNLSFSDFKVETVFSNIFGSVNWIEFQFVDSTLEYLLDKLILWKDQDQSLLDGTRERSQLIFNEKCLERVSLNMIIHFIANFPHDLFDLELKLDIEKLYDKKMKEDKIKFQKNEYKQKGKYCIKCLSFKTIITITGHSALSVCIFDEKTEKWLLKPIFEKLIKQGLYDQNDYGPLHPFNKAIKHDCIKSLMFMTNHESEKSNENAMSSFYPFDFQRLTEQKVASHDKNEYLYLEESFLGVLLKKIANTGYNHQNMQAYVDILDKVSDRIDFNQPLILQKKLGRKISLIEYFASRVSKSGECDQRTGAEYMLYEKICQRNLRAISHQEKLYVVQQTSRLIARYDDNFPCLKRAMKALSILCEQSQIDIVKFSTTEEDGNTKYPMVEYLMSDWSKLSFEYYETIIKGYFNTFRESGSQIEEDPLKRLIETLSTSKEAKQQIYIKKSKEIILAIHKSKIIKFDQEITESAIQFALNELEQDERDEFFQIIQSNLEQSWTKEDVIATINKEKSQQQIYMKRAMQAPETQDTATDLTLRVNDDKASKHPQEFCKEQLAIRLPLKLKDDLSLTQDRDKTKRAMAQKSIRGNLVRYTERNFEIHQYEELNTQESVDNSKLHKKERKKRNGRIIRKFVMFVTELMATLDLVTDVLILKELLKSSHIAWTSLTVFSMLAPFYICHIPYLSFLTEKFKNVKREDRTCKQRFFGFIMVTPLMLIFLFIMDLWFLTMTIIIQPIFLIVSILWPRRNFQWLEQWFDKSYLTFFEMQKLDVLGFRRMRTISQLTFETSIQLLLQIRIYLFMKDWGRGKEFEDDSYDIDPTKVSCSILIAVSHATLELFFIILEARVSKTSLLNYAVVCLNGRYGWVPYQEYLTIRSRKLEQIQNQIDLQKQPSNEVNALQDQDRIQFDYGDISRNFVLCAKCNWSLTLTLDFSFTNDSISSFANVLGTFPKQDQEKDMPFITFKNTIDEISLENLVTLLSLSANRVQINLEGVNLERIFNQSEFAKLLKLDNPNDLISGEEKKFFVRLLKKKNYQLIRYLLEQNLNLIQTSIPSQQNGKHIEDNLGQYVYKTNDAKLLEILLQQNSDEFNKQLGEKKGDQRQTLTLRLLMLQNYEIWEAFANNSDILSGSLLQDLLYMFDSNLKNHQDFERQSQFGASQKFWHARFGNGCPREWSCKLGIQFIKDFQESYPDNVYFSCGIEQKEKIILKFQTKDAFKFAVFRRILVQEWNIQKNGPRVSFDTAGLSEPKAIDLNKYFSKIKGLEDTFEQFNVRKEQLKNTLFQVQVSNQDFKNTEKAKKFLQNMSLIMMIMSEEQHKNVGNLTTSQVKQLDKVAETLMLDTNSWLYYARTRLNDQTGHTIRCTFYGKDVSKLDEERHQIYAGYPYEFSDEDLYMDIFNFSSSLKIDLSKHAKAVLRQSYKFQPIDDRAQIPITLGCFVKNKNHSYFVRDLLTNDPHPGNSANIEFDSQMWAEVDLDKRLQDQQLSRSQAKIMSTVQTFKGNTEINFCTYTNQLHTPNIYNLKIEMDIAFEIEAKMEEIEKILQDKCRESYLIWRKKNKRIREIYQRIQIWIVLQFRNHQKKISQGSASQKWTCTQCELENEPEDQICSCCDKPRQVLN